VGPLPAGCAEMRSQPSRPSGEPLPSLGAERPGCAEPPQPLTVGWAEAQASFANVAAVDEEARGGELEGAKEGARPQLQGAGALSRPGRPVRPRTDLSLAEAETRKVNERAAVQREKLKAMLAQERDQLWKVKVSDHRARLNRWDQKLGRSPFMKDQVIEYRRLAEEMHKEEQQERRRRRLEQQRELEARSTRLHDYICCPDELEQLRQEKRELLEAQYRLKALCRTVRARDAAEAAVGKRAMTSTAGSQSWRSSSTTSLPSRPATSVLPSTGSDLSRSQSAPKVGSRSTRSPPAQAPASRTEQRVPQLAQTWTAGQGSGGGALGGQLPVI